MGSIPAQVAKYLISTFQACPEALNLRRIVHFDNSLSSPAFVPGAAVWFELMEASAADGTPLAIERIKLVIQ